MLILKSKDDLQDVSKLEKFYCFDSLMTKTDVVNFLINLDDELKNTYLVYQEILYSLKNKNYDLLKKALNNINLSISSYIKTSLNIRRKNYLNLNRH